MTSVPTAHPTYYVLSIVREDGTTYYLEKGEYSYYSIGYGNFSGAVKFNSKEEILQWIETHPQFTKRHVYSDGTSSPPSIIWTGLGLCNDKPSAKGWFVIQKVQPEVVHILSLGDSLQQN